MTSHIDTKTILSMFQQSKMAAEDSIDKERMQKINQQIEANRLRVSSDQWRESNATQRDAETASLGEQVREHDQTVAWRAADDVRNTAKDKMEAERYAAELGEKRREANLTHDYQLKMWGIAKDAQTLEKSKEAQVNARTAAANQLMAELTSHAPDSTPNNYETGHWWNISDDAQKKNAGLAEASAKEHVDFVNFVQQAMADPRYSKINVAQIAAPMMNQSAKHLTGLLSEDAMDLRGDQSTFGGGFSMGDNTNMFNVFKSNPTVPGQYGGVYDSEEAKQRWDVQNPIRGALKRIYANPYFQELQSQGK